MGWVGRWFMVPSAPWTGAYPQKKREIRMDRRIGFFIPNTCFAFSRLKIDYASLSTAIKRALLFGGHAGDSPDRILINFLDLYVVTHIILIHNTRLSSATISVKRAFGKPQNETIVKPASERLMENVHMQGFRSPEESPPNGGICERRT